MLLSCTIHTFRFVSGLHASCSHDAFDLPSLIVRVHCFIANRNIKRTQRDTGLYPVKKIKDAVMFSMRTEKYD